MKKDIKSSLKTFFIKIMLRFLGPKGFGKMFMSTNSSPTYSEFCRRVYGRDLCQANMVDEEQLTKLIECLDLNSSISLLDLGCGIGKVAEYVSDTTGAKVLGLDYAPAAIQAANDRTTKKRDRIRFVDGNINNLKSFNDQEFDAIMSIDAIMFAADLSECVSELKRILKPGGTLAIIYHTHNRDNKIPKERLAEELPLGKALLNSGFTFEAFDFTTNEKVIWENTLRVANELKEEFIKEGNLSIFKQRVNEATKVHRLHEQGRVARYLYVARAA